MIEGLIFVFTLCSVKVFCELFPETAAAKFFEAICTDEDKFYAPKNDVKSSLNNNKVA